MASSNYGKLIRTGENRILSATIDGVSPDEGVIHWRFEPFREATQEKCGILFFEYNKRLFYPYSMEFRLIDNNVLFLIEELKIREFNKLKLVLQSSFKREEGREVDFFAVVYKTQSPPTFSLELKDFKFTEGDEVVYVEK